MSSRTSKPRSRRCAFLLGIPIGVCLLWASAQPAELAAADQLPAAEAGAFAQSASPPVQSPIASPQIPVGPDPGNGFVRLAGHIAPALAKAEALSAAAPTADGLMTLTLTLKRDDPAGFERYLAQVYDARSPQFRHFLTQSELTAKFGPSKRDYSEVRRYLKGQGLNVVQDSKNRLTLTVRGMRSDAQQAFRVAIRDYRLGDTQYFANDSDPALPVALAQKVTGIDGLSSLSAPQPIIKSYVYVNVCGATAGGGNGGSQQIKQCVDLTNSAYGVYRELVCDIGSVGTGGDVTTPITTTAGLYGFIALATISIACGLDDLLAGNAASVLPFPLNGIPSANAIGVKQQARLSAPKAQTSSTSLPGSGQKIGLVEFDAFNPSDVSDYLAYMGAPSLIGNLTTKSVSGGVAAPGAGETEVLLDIDTVLVLAPGASVTVYEAPFNGSVTSYTAVFNAMINDGMTIISNSWSSCEDQVSLAQAQSVDAVLQTAAASGISVFNGTGDSGSTCLDGSANTIGVPADSPNATAVGGTSWPNGIAPGQTYPTETWWDGSGEMPPSGQSGFGVSQYFPQPSYQAGISGASMRSIPDVVVRADPANGIAICQADAGGCPSGTLNGGTSLAAPEFAALAAILNQAQGKNLGALNPQLYGLASTPAFHNASALSSDFAHVGLGSPNLNVINRLLKGQAAPGVPVAANSLTAPMIQPFSTALQSNGSFSVPADGTSFGGVVVTLLDANGYTVSGKTVTLGAGGGAATISPAAGVTSDSNGVAVFTVTDLTPETVTFTATDASDGVPLSPVTLTFGVPPAASAGITANPPTDVADGQTPVTITVTLKDGLNRPTPGKLISISDAGAHAVITGPNPAVTDANGQIQFSATDQINETVTFSAVDVTDGNQPFPATASVTYSGSAATACNAGVAPTPGTGYSISAFITGLPAAPNLFYQNVNVGCPGANNPAFTSGGSVLVSDFLTGGIYQTGLSGGTVSTANVIGTLSPALGPLVYGKDGSVYATLGNSNASIVQVNPTTGAAIAVVASGLTCPAGLSVDPLSGDLFFDDQCSGSGTDDPSIYRIIDPSNTDPSRPSTKVLYATLPSTPNGAMAFAPNGTLYAVSGYFTSTHMAPVEAISGTNVSAVTVVAVSGVTSDYAVSIGTANPDGSAQSLIVEPNGTLMNVPIANPSAAVVLATGSPGVGVTGPDGCLYSEHYDTIYRLANSSGTCGFTATSPAPTIQLSPASLPANPAQGTSQTFTATLTNVASPANLPVTFVVRGANAQVREAHTNASGSASLTYSAVVAGNDVITASATDPASGTALVSNNARVTWTAGRDTAFLTLNLSPQGGAVNRPVNVVASLSDVTQSPIAPVAGQTVTLALGSATCSATTNANGTATCSVTPTQAGSVVLSASFAGSSQLTAATATAGFTVSAAGVVAPAPTVTISVKPSSIVVGASATLSWSSTNATACTAGGAWSGSQPISGTSAVSPASSGTFTYTLTCTGSNGQTTSAQATLTATNPVTSTSIIKWSTPAPITYGTPLGHEQLDATANVTGTFAYTPPAGTVLSVGTHQLSVTFTPSNAAYGKATASVTLTVKPAVPCVIWLPLPLFAGTPLGPFQLDAFAIDPDRLFRLVPGKFTYSPKAGTVLSAGDHDLTAIFVPDDSNYGTVTVHATLHVLSPPRWPRWP